MAESKADGRGESSPATRRSRDRQAGSPPAPIADESTLSLKELERREIARALASAPTLRAAALRLGIDPATLWRKRRRLGLD